MLMSILSTQSHYLGKVKLDLRSNFSLLQKWLYENHMIPNPVKCHYMLLGGHTQIDYISLNVFEIESSRNETLGFILGSNLKFDAYVKSWCREAAQKQITLSQINKYLTCDKKFLLVNSAVKY